MKKFLSILLAILFLLPNIVCASDMVVNNEVTDITVNAKSAILIEPTTGKIIYEKNSHEKLAPASMTKIMSMLIIMENIDKGVIKWNDKVTVSSNASGMGGSQILLETGEQMTVYDLFKGVAVASGNDAVVALSEYIAGSEDEFVNLMNEKVKELGLKDTVFKNPHGLDTANHYSSAYDMAFIAKELVKYEKVFEFTSIYEDYLRKGTENEYWLVNTNKLVKTYQGADGLKTGMTDNAGYCMAVTAKRDNMRLLAIVLGEESGKVRNQETTELLDYGFNLYEVTTIKKKGEVLGNIKIDKANLDSIDIVAGSDVTILKKQTDVDKEYKSDVKLNTLNLPIKKGEEIGSLIVRDDLGNKIDEVIITVGVDINKDNLFNIFLKIMKSMIQGELL